MDMFYLIILINIFLFYFLLLHHLFLYIISHLKIIQKPVLSNIRYTTSGPEPDFCQKADSAANNFVQVQACEQLGIEKKEIKKGRPYQNYIEAALYVIWNLNDSENCQDNVYYVDLTLASSAIFKDNEGQFHIIGVQRRMADWSFEKAQTWEDLLAAHDKWMSDYNFQRVRRVGADRIPFTERRGWSNTPGSRDSPGGETQRGPKHVTKALKRKKTLTPLAMQDPRDTAKLGLLNSSSQRFEGWPFASTASSCRDSGIQLPCRWVAWNALSGE